MFFSTKLQPQISLTVYCLTLAYVIQDLQAQRGMVTSDFNNHQNKIVDAEGKDAARELEPN